jgi:hypothetical protein
VFDDAKHEVEINTQVVVDQDVSDAGQVPPVHFRFRRLLALARD